LTDTIKGKIWTKVIEKEALANYQADLKVISTHLKAGKTVIHVLSDNQPDATFDPFTADLEDVYFSEITSRMNTTLV
jgi:hypothetical protein